MFAMDSNRSTTEEAAMTAGMHTRRELAHRVNNGIEVWLYWERVGDTLTVEVYDLKLDEYFELDVPRDRALDAFRHPFAYRAAAQARDARQLLAA
jgi:hypothetical protein